MPFHIEVYYWFLGFLGWSINGNPRKATVSRSSEVEYHALTALTCEIKWLFYLLHDLHISHHVPPWYFVTTNILSTLLETQLLWENQHIEINCHLVRQKLQEGSLQLLLTSSSNQLCWCIYAGLNYGPACKGLTELKDQHEYLGLFSLAYHFYLFFCF